MAMTRSIDRVLDNLRHQLGFYAFVRTHADPDTQETESSEYAECEPKFPKILVDAHRLSSLSEHELCGVRCVIVDIRQNASLALQACHHAATRRPIIVLADPDQQFADEYPFGTYVSDVTTVHELGTSVFWHRVSRAVRHYDKPLSLTDTSSPTYGVFKAIADQSSDWVIVKDLDHRFVVAGENFAATAGIALDKIIGSDDLQIGSSPEAVLGNPDTGDTGFWAQDKMVTDSGEATVEENPEWLLYARKARYRRTYRVPLKNPAGRVFALLVCSQDITEQRRNEELLGERTSMLEQVTEEKKYADVSRKIAEDAVAAKTRFLAAASHDLRQPLHAMGLFLDSLEKRIEGREEYCLVQQIKQSCTALSNLFSSCLDISRLDAGVVEQKPEHFSAARFLEELHEEFRQQAREKFLDYRLVVDDSVVYSDRILLARIVRNLLNNAIQNTDSGYLCIECRRAAACIEMSVIDTGSGIAAEQLENVFTEFHQINPSDARRERGLGLGLSIVKRLGELLDIRIALESTLGQGTRFTLSIPAGELALEMPEKPMQAVVLPEKLLVLIVEDDAAIRFGMQVLLESFGCTTLCAMNTEAALGLLKADASAPDIIVADYHLAKDTTGTQAIIDLRAAVGANVPAVLVTGDTSWDSEREAALHDLPILYKPVDSDELLATINNAVRRNSA